MAKTEVATDLICVVQKNHLTHKANKKIAEEKAMYEKEIAERNANAIAYSASIERKEERKEKIKETLFTVALATVEFGGLLAMIIYAFLR